MVSSLLDSVLKDLETFFHCHLEADSNQSCLIKMGIGISLQIELNGNNMLLIACVLGTLPISQYRFQILKQALKANDIFPPSTGSFGYSSKTNHLLLFMILDPNKLNSNTVFTILPPYIEKAKIWKEAIENQSIPEIEVAANTQPSHLFGLKSLSSKEIKIERGTH